MTPTAGGARSRWRSLPANHKYGSMNKRDFLRSVGGASLGLLLGDQLWA